MSLKRRNTYGAQLPPSKRRKLSIPAEQSEYRIVHSTNKSNDSDPYGEWLFTCPHGELTVDFDEEYASCRLNINPEIIEFEHNVLIKLLKTLLAFYSATSEYNKLTIIYHKRLPCTSDECADAVELLLKTQLKPFIRFEKDSTQYFFLKPALPHPLFAQCRKRIASYNCVVGIRYNGVHDELIPNISETMSLRHRRMLVAGMFRKECGNGYETNLLDISTAYLSVVSDKDFIDGKRNCMTFHRKVVITLSNEIAVYFDEPIVMLGHLKDVEFTLQIEGTYITSEELSRDHRVCKYRVYMQEQVSYAFESGGPASIITGFRERSESSTCAYRYNDFKNAVIGTGLEILTMHDGDDQ